MSRLLLKMVIVNSAAVNSGVHVPFELQFSQGVASETLLYEQGSAWCSVMTSRWRGERSQRGGDTCGQRLLGSARKRNQHIVKCSSS